jgi:pimeloyl-ACP methyl ester carboxylesterase
MPYRAAMVDRVPYDEFAYFHENAEEFGLPHDRPPIVRRERVTVEPGREVSALVWGEGRPELVLLHGGAQNAHTWDTVAMALGRPLVAFDLPNHGHSDGGRDGAFGPHANAQDIATAMDALAPSAEAVVGMSLGGLTTLALADHRPDLVHAVVLVDVTPGVDEEKARTITSFIDGPPSFPSFEDLLARTIEFNPTRTVSSLRRGILHNAAQLEDGSWVWRYARFRLDAEPGQTRPMHEFGSLWDAVSNLQVPLMLVRGMREQSVVDDADEAELLRHCPTARVEHVAEAGHSVQGDTPVELARLIDSFVPRP